MFHWPWFSTVIGDGRGIEGGVGRGQNKLHVHGHCEATSRLRIHQCYLLHGNREAGGDQFGWWCLLPLQCSKTQCSIQSVCCLSSLTLYNTHTYTPGFLWSILCLNITDCVCIKRMKKVWRKKYKLIYKIEGYSCPITKQCHIDTTTPGCPAAL